MESGVAGDVIRAIFLHGMEFSVVLGMGSIVWVTVHGYDLVIHHDSGW